MLREPDPHEPELADASDAAAGSQPHSGVRLRRGAEHPLPDASPPASEPVATDGALAEVPTRTAMERPAMERPATAAPRVEPLPIRALAAVGAAVIVVVTTWARWVQALFAAQTDDAPHAPTSLARHVFLTGARALPVVCVVAAGAGAAIVLQAKMAPTPPSPEFGRMLVVVVLRELAPALTAIVVAGHSGTAAAAELQPAALALAGGVRRAMRARVAGTTIAMLVLMVYFAAVAMVSGYLVSQLLTLRTLGAIREGIQQELRLLDVAVFLVKGIGLGALVGWLSCHFALAARSSPLEIARSASRTFVVCVLACTGYSVAVTVVVYAIIGAPQPP